MKTSKEHKHKEHKHKAFKHIHVETSTGTKILKASVPDAEVEAALEEEHNQDVAAEMESDKLSAEAHERSIGKQED